MFQAYEKTVLQALYGYVRAGQLEEAVELCRKSQQPWRAASIRGALLFQWHAIGEYLTSYNVRIDWLTYATIYEANEPRDENAMDDEEADDSQQWRGNVRRRMWKRTCECVALNVCNANFLICLLGTDHFASQQNLPLPERALYAALAPSSATALVLKGHSRTWEDHLWALVSVACEERLSAGLTKIERECFWEGGLGALEHGATTLSDGQAPDAGDEESWEEDVLETLSALSSVQVSEGYVNVLERKTSC